MKLNQKLLSGFLTIALLTLIVSYFTGMLVQENTMTNFQEVGGEMLPGNVALARMTTELYNTLVLVARFAEKGNIEDKQKIDKTLSTLSTYKTMHVLYHREDEAWHAQVDELVQKFSSYITEYLLLIQIEGEKEEMNEVKLKIDEILDDFSSLVNQHFEADFDKSFKKLEATKQQNLKARKLLLGSSIAILIIAFGLSLFMSRLLSRPILKLRNAAMEIGKGRLDIDLQSTSRDEIGELAGAFNEMAINLSKAKEEIEIMNRELEERVREKTEELLRSQAQLIQSEKLSAMGQMAGGLAHELNSPLAGLMPMIKIYRDKEEKDSKRHKELSLMLEACKYMAKIVRDFSSFSRESKGIFSELNVNEVIDDTLGFSAGRIKQQGIKLIKEYENELPKVHGEKTELQQVILNMITNALDAMTDAGKLRIRTDIIKDNVIMEFIDNGAGIGKEYLNNIFDPFYTTKKPGKGTGLGLSISYKIIEKHGGNISVESEPEKETKFTIYLPAVKPNNT